MNQIDIERSLLGTLLAWRGAKIDLCGDLRPEHFSDHQHGEVFTAIKSGAKAGRAVDAVILSRRFDRAFLTKLLSSLVSVENISTYAAQIRSNARKHLLLDDIVASYVLGVADDSPPDEDLPAEPERDKSPLEIATTDFLRAWIMAVGTMSDDDKEKFIAALGLRMRYFFDRHSASREARI